MSSEQEMRAKLTACPECGGERVIAQTPSTLQLVRADAALPAFAPMTGLWAVVCLSCGHTTFYAKKPGALALKE